MRYDQDPIQPLLIAAMNRLSLAPQQNLLVSREANTLATMIALARVNDAPAGSMTTKKDGARRQLLGLADKLRELNDTISGLNADSRGYLRQAARGHPASEWDLPEVEALQIHLSNTFNNTVRALRETPHQDGKGGAPKKVVASIIADFARVSFESLTGRDATVITDPITSEGGGPFVRFLAEVLAAARVEASAEAQARAAIRRADQGIAPGQQATMMTVRQLAKEETL